MTEDCPPLHPSPKPGRGKPFWQAWTHLWCPIPDLDAVGTETAHEPPPEEHEFCALWAQMRSEYKALVLGSPDATPVAWESAATRGLMAFMRTNAPSGRSFVAQRRVAEILAAGNRLGMWKIAIPDIPAPLPPAPRSPFRSAVFSDLVQHQSLFDDFIERIHISVPVGDAHAYWGRIILSAVLFGGLLRVHWLWALTRCLETGPGHGYWLELERKPQVGVQPEHIRWYPDPVTRHLLVRARLDTERPQPPEGRLSGPNLYRCIRAFAQWAGIEDALPRNWSRLSDVARTHLSLYAPPYLVAHATGRCAATSIPLQARQRQITPPTTMRFGRIAEEKVSTAPRSAYSDEQAGDRKKAAERDGDEESWPTQLRELSTLIRRKDPVRSGLIQEWLSASRPSDDPLLPSVQRLGEWVANKLCKPPRRKRTVYELFNAAAGRIAGQMGAQDPAALQTVDDYTELYATALEDATSSAALKRVARALKSFHQYMVAAHEAPKEPLDILNAARFTKGRHIPDANYVDPLVLDRTVRWIDFRFRDEPQRGTVLVLLLSLGFYAGLRRSEATGLSIRDLGSGPEYELLVQQNSHRLLKSSSARRVLPLAWLLPSDLLERLLDWRANRLAELEREGVEDLSAAPLLTITGVKPLRDTDPLLEEGTRALAQVSGDASLRFHHLRHSFGSGLLVHLWEAEEAEQPRNPPWAPEPVIKDPARLRDALIGRAPTQRRALRLISHLMGHADTKITVEHYLHTADDLLGRAVRRVHDDLTTQNISDLTGASASYVRTLRTKLSPGQPADIIDKLSDRLLEKDQSLQMQYSQAATGDGLVAIEQPRDMMQRLMLLAEAINCSHLGETPPRPFHYPWSDETLQRYAKVLEGLPETMRKRRPPRAASNRLIDPVSQKGVEVTAAKKTTNYLFGESSARRITLRSKDRHQLLDSYVAGHLPDWPLLSVRMDSVPDLKRWLRFLKTVGLLERFTVHHIPKPRSSVGSAETQFASWEKVAASFEVPITAAESWHGVPPTNSRGAVLVLPSDRIIPVSRGLFGVVCILGIGVLFSTYSHQQ